MSPFFVLTGSAVVFLIFAYTIKQISFTLTTVPERLIREKVKFVNRVGGIATMDGEKAKELGDSLKAKLMAHRQATMDKPKPKVEKVELPKAEAKVEVPADPPEDDLPF